MNNFQTESIVIRSRVREGQCLMDCSILSSHHGVVNLCWCHSITAFLYLEPSCHVISLTFLSCRCCTDLICFTMICYDFFITVSNLV